MNLILKSLYDIFDLCDSSQIIEQELDVVSSVVVINNIRYFLVAYLEGHVDFSFLFYTVTGSGPDRLLSKQEVINSIISA